MIFDEIRETNLNNRPFRVEKIDADGRAVTGYTLYAAPWTTLDSAWDSQKYWFSKGSRVRITDEKGNKKIFERK